MKKCIISTSDAIRLLSLHQAMRLICQTVPLFCRSSEQFQKGRVPRRRAETPLRPQKRAGQYLDALQNGWGDFYL